MLNFKATRQFFFGLSPEGDKRKLVARERHVSRQNDFGLLDGIGGECAGAFTPLPPGQTPQADVADDAVQWLTSAELVGVLGHIPRRPMLAGQQDMRLLLSGARQTACRRTLGGWQVAKWLAQAWLAQ